MCAAVLRRKYYSVQAFAQVQVHSFVLGPLGLIERMATKVRRNFGCRHFRRYHPRFYFQIFLLLGGLEIRS